MMKLPKQAFKVGLSFLVTLGLWSCGKEEKTEDAAPCAAADAIVAEANYNSLWTNVFEGRCGSCHGVGATGTAGGPDMRTKEIFFSNVVGKSIADYPSWLQAQSTLEDCLTTPLINKSRSSESLLIGTLDATAFTVKCSPKPHKEPPQNVCISAGSLANLKKWIDNGALQ